MEEPILTTSKDERTAFRQNGHARKCMHAQRRGIFVQGRHLSAVGLLTLDGCQDWFFTDLIFRGVRARSSSKTERLRSIVVLPEG